MALPTGTRLGPYEIGSLLGVGGMGEVYRATDTNLKRAVAIKVLPPLVANDADRLARFQREAEVLASLNHPGIAQIYGLERADGVTALVMELVDGEDLAQRIVRGPVAIAEALTIAQQIAEALEAAHEQGIVHRDLKPANIKLRPDGTVKVLDFGLAKALAPEGAAATAVSMSPTLSVQATYAGMILGTAAYMSPEQARGRRVDKRTDIWAFGCVLFEMLSGARPFDGEDIVEAIGAVVHKDPAWDLLPAATPPTVRTVIERCLRKDPKERLRDIGDVLLALKGAFEPPAASATGAAQAAVPTRSLWKRAIPVAAAAVLAGAMVGGAAWMLKPIPSVSRPVGRFVITLGEGQQFSVQNQQSLALSPDGTLLAYVANGQLYLRSLSELEARPIAGTLQTPTLSSPVFSPDGLAIAFYSQSDRAIEKIAIGGGAAVTVCRLDSPSVGISWDATGIVFVEPGKGIQRVAANGGQPETLVAAREGEYLYGPRILPGGEWVLFSSATAPTSDAWDKALIVAQSLKSSERKTLVTGGSDARYLPTGHLVYALSGVLFAAPFDLKRMAVTGGNVPVVEGVKRSSSGAQGTAHLGISDTGSLVFAPGPVASSAAQVDLAIIERSGLVQPLKLQLGPYESPRLSPNGKQIAFGGDDGRDAVVWIYDVSGKSAPRRLTLGGRNRVPVWSPDSEHVAFQSDREGDKSIWWQRTDGTTPAERLTKPDKDISQAPESWSPDGKTLLFSVAKGDAYSIEALSFPDKKVTPLGGTQSKYPPGAAFSPDGKWVAYSIGDTTSAGPLFVQPFPPTGATYPIAKAGIHPAWSLDGKELVFNPAPSQTFAVSVTTRPALTFGNPVSIPRNFQEHPPIFERNYDLMSDGRILGVALPGQTTSGATAAPQIQVVLNWFEELKQRVPTR